MAELSLDEYLSDVSLAPFAYGSTDCVKFVTAWVAENTGNDPSLPFGQYDEAIANKILNEHGGLVDLLNKHLGLNCTDTIKRGDVAVVRPRGLDEDVCAICMSTNDIRTLWAFRTERGILVTSGFVVMAWRLDHA